ncbi:hypothetical protein BDW_08340 [Bdellovibrio bacteriovorus W]|nr:hypothetical protein BDW_08340 [Bdellovibrio bacteriovorus W]
MKAILAFAIGLFGFVGTSHAAGFYVEPGITWERSDNEVRWPAPLDNSTGNQQGLGVNLKLGMHISDAFFAGLNGYYSKPKFEQSANDYSADATSTLYGAVIGGQMPKFGLRIWAGYIFGGELDPDSSNNVDVKFTEAKGPMVGVGFHILKVSLNIEYMDLEYGKSSVEGPFTGELDNKLKSKLGLISVSLPLTL